jgi:hypothetical protein
MLKGTWRGYVAKHHGPNNFPMGEWYATFDNNTLTTTWTDGTKHHYDVSTIAGGSIQTKDKDTGNVAASVFGTVADLKYT